MDDQKDPTERERIEDEDLEMDEEQAEDVKGGYDVPIKQTNTAYKQAITADRTTTSTTSTSYTQPTTDVSRLGQLPPRT